MKLFNKTAAAALLSLSFLTMSGGANAQGNLPDIEQFRPLLEKFARGYLQTIVTDPLVVAAIREQNVKHANITPEEIDKLDKQWRAEAKAGSGPLIKSVLDNPLSAWLIAKQSEGLGIMAEIFVMDNKGLNVGQSNITSDYMQGDEPKWQQTYGKGPGQVLLEKVTFDESANTFVSQVSMTVIDPQTGKEIGAVTASVDLGKL